MPDALVQVTIPSLTADPKDSVVNTWSFEIVDDTEDNYSEVGSFLFTFYSELVGIFYGPTMDFSQWTTKIYLRSDPEPRVPRAEGIQDLGDGNLGAGPVPEEVSMCLSFRGVYAAGSPKARRRGRVFLGPLRSELFTILGERIRFNTSAQEVVRDAYQLATAQLTTVGNRHVVWSGTDGVAYPVVELWVDNAPDTQRRRGPAPTSRLTFPIE